MMVTYGAAHFNTLKRAVWMHRVGSFAVLSYGCQLGTLCRIPMLRCFGH